MAMPATYDDVSLSVSPLEMDQQADAVVAAAKGIIDDLSAIMGSLSQLALSWIGDSASDAIDFTTRWQNAVASLYGTEKDPNKGILVVLLNGVKSAAKNYDECEKQIEKMFGAFVPGPAPAPITNPSSDWGDPNYVRHKAYNDTVNVATDEVYQLTSVNEYYGPPPDTNG